MALNCAVFPGGCGWIEEKTFHGVAVNACTRVGDSKLTAATELRDETFFLSNADLFLDGGAVIKHDMTPPITFVQSPPAIGPAYWPSCNVSLPSTPLYIKQQLPVTSRHVALVRAAALGRFPLRPPTHSHTFVRRKRGRRHYPQTEHAHATVQCICTASYFLTDVNSNQHSFNFNMT